MLLNELPLQWMNTKMSQPSQYGLESLVNISVPYHIEKEFLSPDDRADAYDGAFVGLHIHKMMQLNHLVGNDETEACEFVKAWHEKNGYTIKSPFYYGLKTTLQAYSHDKLYSECINFILGNKKD